MKKKLLSLLFVLVLMAAVIPSASADYYSFQTGDYVDIQLLVIPGDATYDVSDVPIGCNVVEDGAAGSKGLILRGTASVPGEYYFSLYASTGESVYHTITVEDPIPPVPWLVSWTQSKGVTVGDTLYLETQVSNPSGYDLYYTWYVDGVPVGGADASSLYVDTSEVGTHYYRCSIECYLGSVQYVMETDNIWIEVTEKPYVKSIDIKYEPDKTVYKRGEYLDAKGLCIWLNYSDNVQIEEWTDFSCSPTFLNRAGDQKITVSYGSLKAYFYVTVEEKKDLREISIAHAPNKSTYNIGDLLDTSGLAINAKYTDNTTEVLSSGFNCSPTALKAEGNQIVTVSYENKTCSFNVTVKDPKKVKGISIADLPTKTEYKVGEPLDLTGLRIKVETESDSTFIDAKDSRLSFSPLKLDKEGEQNITVTYTDKMRYNCSFKIKVGPRDAPTASPTESGKPTDGDKQDEKQEERGSNTLGIVLLVITILALGAGGAVLYIAKSKNSQYRTKKDWDDLDDDDDDDEDDDEDDEDDEDDD